MDFSLVRVKYLVVCCSRGALTVGLPPAWVDVSEEIAANVQRVRVKIGELSKAHAKALMPSFGDGKEDQCRIEALTQEITGLLKKSEKRLQRLSAGGPSKDSNIRKNVQDFYEEGEREMLLAEVSELQDQLVCFLNGNSKQHNHPKLDMPYQEPQCICKENDRLHLELNKTLNELEKCRNSLSSCLEKNAILRREHAETTKV